MKRILFIILFIILCCCNVFAVCNKPNHIPAGYNVVSCDEFVGNYINAYIVENNNLLGVYTNWEDPALNSCYPFNARNRYNRLKVPVKFDKIEIVKNGFIVEKNLKYGYYHIDKGEIFEPKYDKIYLSNNSDTVYAMSNNTTISKKNPDNYAKRVENFLFNIFIRPLFFWLDDALPNR